MLQPQKEGERDVSVIENNSICHKAPKFLDARKPCCNQPKIAKPEGHANGIANSEDPDQTAPLGAV